MLPQKWRSEALVDVINLTLGAFLVLAPWIFGFSGLARHNAWITGVAIGIVAIAAIAEFTESEKWINLIVGLWAAVSPWIMGFQAETPAMRVHLIVRLVVAALAAVELWLVHRSPPQVTA